jgi:hypothetical protein
MWVGRRWLIHYQIAKRRHCIHLHVLLLCMLSTRTTRIASTTNAKMEKNFVITKNGGSLVDVKICS